MGPTPKISVRAVSEASTSASMRPFRSAIFRSSVRMLSAAPPKLTVGGGGSRRALGPYAAQDARGPVGRERPGHRGGEEVPQEPVEAALSARVRSSTRSSRLSERRRSTSEAASGSTVGSRSLREAARARWRGHRARRSCGRCRSKAPAPAPKAWAPRPPLTPRRPLPISQPGADPEAASVLYRPTALGEPLRPAFEGSQAGAVMWEVSMLDEPAYGFVEHCDGDRRLVGIDPDQDLHARMHLRSGRASAIGARAKDTPTSGPAPIPLLSHSARRSLRRDASREQANPISGRQEVRERSLYNRRPRSS